uniref:Uncharacterized protein n=1 Tax=Plectus sambesii TaxID=2011161 RepID=A0A914V5C9_9BILA
MPSGADGVQPYRTTVYHPLPTADKTARPGRVAPLFAHISQMSLVGCLSFALVAGYRGIGPAACLPKCRAHLRCPSCRSPRLTWRGERYCASNVPLSTPVADVVKC